MNRMKSYISLFLASSIVAAFASCTGKGASDGAQDGELELADSCVEMAVDSIPESHENAGFESVAKWVVELEAMSSFSGVCSEEEARKIEAGGSEDDSQWVEYDEEEDQWIVHGLGYVPQGTFEITNAKHVKTLNAMMMDEKYSDYRMDVSIKGNTAFAKWYNGNRGGGIEEDFPEDVVNFIYAAGEEE